MKRAIVLAVLALLVAASPAWAAIDVLSAFANGQNNLHDVSGDKLININGGADTTVDVGDILLSSFNFDTIQNAAHPLPMTIGLGSQYSELSGLIAIKVLSVSGPVANPLSPTGVSYAWTFGPATDATSLAAINAVSPNAAAAISAWGKGTLASFFDDPTPDYSRNGVTVDADVATATDGLKVLEIGFTGGTLDANGNPTAINGEAWSAVAISNDISLIGAVPFPGNGGTVNFSLRNSDNPPDSLILDALDTDTLTSLFNPTFKNLNLNGSANLLGTGTQDTAWDAFDNADATMDITPEPASCVVWTLLLGCIGVAAWRRRR
jgi:hypothetical protein